MYKKKNYEPLIPEFVILSHFNLIKTFFYVHSTIEFIKILELLFCLEVIYYVLMNFFLRQNSMCGLSTEE